MEERKYGLKNMLLSVVVSALFYFLLDYPIRLSGAYDFPNGIGVKSFLPFVLGLYLGPSGAVGAAAGATLAARFAGETTVKILAECLCILLIGNGMWAGWFSMNKTGNVRLEKVEDYRHYVLLVGVLSVCCGALTSILAKDESFLFTTVGYLVSGYMVSGLVVILLGGIFCLDPVLPPWCKRKSDIVFHISRDEGLAMANEQIEDAALLKGVGMKRVFEIENCLEELYIRIKKELPDADIFGRMDMGTTISLRLVAKGKNYDPLAAGAEEDETDLAGLRLIRHRALRASHDYREGENRVHVVI